MLQLLRPEEDLSICKAALGALQQYDDAAIGERVAGALPRLPSEGQTAAFVLLGSRPSWAAALLEAVDAGTIAKQTVPQDTLRRVKLYSGDRTVELFRKHWGDGQPQPSAELQQKIQALAGVMHNGSASPYEGQKVFSMACAVCHKLFGQGGQIGPDLTTYKRDDVDVMLLNIVNPSAEVREGYENYLVSTRDGRTLSGFLADKDQRVIVLRALDGENSVIPQDQIVSMKSTGLSLMPEGLLDILQEQQVRDLFAYLRSTQPLVK